MRSLQTHCGHIPVFHYPSVVLTEEVMGKQGGLDSNPCTYRQTSEIALRLIFREEQLFLGGQFFFSTTLHLVEKGQSDIGNCIYRYMYSHAT
jgi:hypothetical protein